MQRNVLEYLEQTWRGCPDKTAFSNGTDGVTFAEVSGNARRIGTVLAKRGFAAEPVVVFMEKHPRSVVAFFGVVYAGCYYVPLDEEMPLFRVELILNTLRPRACIVDGKTGPVVEKLLADRKTDEAETAPMAVKREYDFEGVGKKDMYLLHHEEIEALGRNMPEVKRIRFFMTFGQSYLTHMNCLENVGMLSTTPIEFEGHEIVPIKFLKALLPDPASLGPRTHGKTNIGCIFTGKKDGKDKTYYIYNVCDHQECYKEVESQAISYTTGVPAMCGAMMLLTGKWTEKGVHTVEEFDPDPFIEALDKYGLPKRESHAPVLVE